MISLEDPKKRRLLLNNRCLSVSSERSLVTVRVNWVQNGQKIVFFLTFQSFVINLVLKKIANEYRSACTNPMSRKF